MRILGLERSGTNYPMTRLHTPEVLITQPLITSCHLMSAKISCFVCQQLTETFLHARGSAPLISAEHVSAAHSHEAGELKTHIF